MILHQRPLRTIYDTLSLTNSTLLTADANNNNNNNYYYYYY
jgi:hypothetical protein